ncbi:hypothetical protein BTS2_3351 [Bacillus sp. TS-2]|nr:hypothetical protein BTS2_3351 [Bacillus sp. TS-2]
MKKIIFLTMILLFTGIFSLQVSAANNELGFTVTRILPENQDINFEYNPGIWSSVSPNSNSLNQEFEFKVKNITDEKIEVNVQALNALTSPQGGIEYTESTESRNSQLIERSYSFSDYVDLDETIDLEPNEEKVIKVNVNVKGLEGTLLGGIGFSPASTQNFESEEMFKAKNIPRAVLGIQINLKGYDTSPKLIFDNPYVDENPSYFIVRLPITLDDPYLLKGGQLTYQVETELGEVLFETNEQGIDLAPKTKTNYEVAWSHSEIKEGETYIIKGFIDYQGELSEFEKEFVYTKNQSDFYESTVTDLTTPDVKSSSFIWWLIATSFILLTLFFILWKKRLYALDTNQQMVQETIDSKNPSYNDLLERKRDKSTKYIHYYKRKKITSSEYVFDYKKSKMR